MSHLIRVLVVGDQSATTDLLRSRLEPSDYPFRVVSVRSAEEALLAIRRVSFALVITDEDLPEMDGPELVRLARRVRPGTVAFVIARRPSQEGAAKAERYGAVQYLHEPVDPGFLLELLYEVVGVQAPDSVDDTVSSTVIDQDPQITLTASVGQILDDLRSDTGAKLVILGNLSGRLLSASGATTDLDLPRLTATIATGVAGSLRLAEQVGDEEPTAVQYLAGKNTDLYAANVGWEHFLAVLSDDGKRRGQIGVIWVFAQRAIKELSKILVPDVTPLPESRLVGGSMLPEVAPQEVPAVSSPPSVTETNREGAPPAEQIQNGEIESAKQSEIDLILAEVLGGEVENLDLDAYWDEALSEDIGSPISSTAFSLEEARNKGIIASDFEPEE